MIQYRLPVTNLFACATHEPRTSTREPIIDWTRVRRARPLDRLLPATQRWANSLAKQEKPIQLMKMYPRIANRLAFAWDDPKAVQDVLDDVLIDRRGGRQGFPPVVQAELIRLRSAVLVADGVGV